METPTEIIEDMMKKATERDALPCGLIYHDIVQRGEVRFNAIWLFDAPYAHPLWSQYAVLLMDLTTPYEQKPVIYKPGVTHEVICFALDPEVKAVTPPPNEKPKWRYLNPPNFAYQFTADTDQAALKRIDDLVMMFIKKKLSPDTDYRRAHDALFADGVSLAKGGIN